MPRTRSTLNLQRILKQWSTFLGSLINSETMHLCVLNCLHEGSANFNASNYPDHHRLLHFVVLLTFSAYWPDTCIRHWILVRFGKSKLSHYLKVKHTFQWSESESIYVYGVNAKETELEVPKWMTFKSWSKWQVGAPLDTIIGRLPLPLLTFWRRNYFFLILAHSVYKLWIIQVPNTLDLWNKLHFEEEKMDSIYHA